MLSIELPSLWLSFLGPKTIASLIALLVFCLESFFRRDPLRHIPGPFLARWTPLWLGYQARMGRRYIAVDNAHKKYGRVVRIAPNHISVADKDALPVVYSYGSATFEKSDFYHAFVADRPSVFSTVDRREHAQKRRLVSHAFSYEALQNFSGFIQANIEIFTGKLDEMCKAGQDIDLLTWLNYLTFDVLSDLAFGEPIGMLTNGTDVVKVQLPDGSVLEENAISLVDGREHMSAVMGIHPSFSILAKYIPDPFCIRGLKSSTGLSNFSRRRVTKRVESGTYREDILNKLILARTKESDTMSAEQLTELIAETVTLLSAGSDTTASSVAAIVHLVKTHPCVYKKLLAELESHVGHNEIPEHNQVKNLPYLQAVVDEGLRHYATMAIGLPRVVPAEGFYAGGKYLPGGVEVSIPAYTIQHDEEIWGDPEVFRPERWLESEERRQYLRRYLLTFGKGPRSCLGKNLAYMETQLMLATILLRYDIELKSNVLETTEGFVHKVLHLMVKLGRR